jgi:hypothetical protein
MTSRDALRRLAPAATALMLAWLAWRALSLGVADHFSAARPERALAWRPDHPQALLARAETLAGGTAVRPVPDALRDPVAAAALARRALRADPLPGRGWRVLAQLADRAGDRARAASLQAIAARRSPRDLDAHVWLVDHHLGRRDPVAALASLDLILRTHPQAGPGVVATLMRLAQSPDAQPALAGLLQRSPRWRTGMLVGVIRHEEADTVALAPLIEALRRSGGLAPDELAAWIDRLVAEGRWGTAYLTWVSQLPPARLDGLGNVYNGGFEWTPQPGGFDWHFGKVAGARIDRVDADGGTGDRALRVAFEGQRVAFDHVRQRLVLPPGRYRLAGQVRLDGLRNERGLVWTVACADGARTPLAETPPMRGSAGWRAFETGFVVPAEGCGGQWLVLRIPARIAAERRVVGQAWFDDISVTREREEL